MTVFLCLLLALLILASCTKPDQLATSGDQDGSGDKPSSDQNKEQPTSDFEPSTGVKPTAAKESPEASMTPDIPENGDYIPDYAYAQTLYQELRANDGVLLARNEYWQPVFSGEGDNVNKMNKAFSGRLAGVSLADFEWLPESYDNREGYTYEEAQSGRVGGYTETWEESWRDNRYISFAAYGDWDGLGAHGGFSMSGLTFDAMTGERLSIADVLSVPVEMITDVLYDEYISYQSGVGDGSNADMARGNAWDGYEEYYIDSVKSQCGADAVFWLASDGVNIFFDQYTFFYAAGASWLVIPYSRFDLIRAPFAKRPS